MQPDSTTNQAGERPGYSARTPDYYLEQLDPEIRASLSAAQLAAVRDLLGASIPKPAPKLVDLRFWLDFLAYRYYVVLYIGKDRRQGDRGDLTSPMARKGNILLVVLLLIGLNLLISLFVLAIALGIKYLVGLSLFPLAPIVG